MFDSIAFVGMKLIVASCIHCSPYLILSDNFVYRIPHYLKGEEHFSRGESLAAVNPVSDAGTKHDDCETLGKTIDAH